MDENSRRLFVTVVNEPRSIVIHKEEKNDDSKKKLPKKFEFQVE